MSVALGACAPTDEQGVASFEEVRCGRVGIRAWQHGLLFTRGTAFVEEGRTTFVDLVEPAGGTVDLEVMDEAGRPLPYATVGVRTSSREPWCDEQDGVQRIDPFTDVGGRRRLARLEPGEVTLEIRWGSRRVERTLAVAEGGWEVVWVHLPPGDA